MDVAVDIRQGSPTFKQHIAVEISAQNKLQLFIPIGFAHGFVVLSDYAVLSYKVDNYYKLECDKGLYFADAQLAINWGIPTSSLKLSTKDKKLDRFSKLDGFFDYHTNYYA